MTSQLGLWAFVRRAASVLVVGVVALLVALAWAAAPAGAGLAAATHEHGSTPHVDIEEANSPVFGYDHRSDFARPPSAEVETNGYDSSSDLVDPAAEGSSIPRASWGLGADRVAPSRLAGAACSFRASTAVLMADGSAKPIAEIEIGDFVLAEDPETGERGARKVTRLWVHEDQITDLELDDGSRVSTTEDHPFWNVTDTEWQRADALDPGDLLLSADGDLLAVDDLDPASTRTTTAYNLTVEDIHTYFVRIGTEDILVHNNNTCGLGGVYTLTDDAGNIVRTGRTNNVMRREAEHLRQFGDDLRFDTVFRTDDLATQRGLEQILYNRNPSAQLANGGLNRIRPISVRNPRTLVYEDAAVRYLQQMGLL